jgi:hypothetical protein
MKKIFLLLLATALCSFAQAQKKYTISGHVVDAKNGEEIIGATVVIKDNKKVGTRTNSYGFYSLTLSEGAYTLLIRSVGFETQELPISLTKNTTEEIKLSAKQSQLKKVVIKTRKDNDQIINTEIGVAKLDMKMVNKIPVLFGERDILKTIQLLPGVKSAGEGNSGFYVRGGSADQNLVLLDEAPVYNASHLLGFFSVFNSDAIKDVKLYKGTAPSPYGGRLSSVLDVKMKDGNNQNYSVSGGIGLIASRLNIEGPIVKDKGSFLVSARRTYADAFTVFSKDTNVQKAKLYFYDFNAKANYKINDNNRIYLSGYFGKDVLGFGDQFGFDWGNATATLRWNHIYNQKLFSNTSLIFSNFNYNIDVNLGSAEFNINSRIRDWNLKQDYQYFATKKSEFKFGVNSIYHNIIPGALSIRDDSLDFNLELSTKYGWENAIYASHKYKFNGAFNIEYGLRLSSWSNVGAGTFYSYDAEGNQEDSTVLKRGEIGKTYVNLEPRLVANYTIDEKSSLKASYTRNTQNLHLLSNSNAGNPTDVWIGSSNNVKPEIADQVALGYFRNFDNNNYEVSGEVYYKHMQNQIDYKPGAELLLNENVESQLLYGFGRAYGLELFAKKKYGRLNGWVGYTLSKTERKIEGINNGEFYNAKQDRTHEISVVGIYEISKKLTLSSTWIYYTGNAITYPRGKYTIDNQTYFLYSERNADRMPDYHRLDLGLTWTRKKTDRKESSWNFSIYNAYNRANAYSIDFRDSPTNFRQTEAVQTTLFKIIPSISYNFKF